MIFNPKNLMLMKAILGGSGSGSGDSDLGKNAIVKCGTINPGGQECTITHGLGVVPDIFVIALQMAYIGSAGAIMCVRYSAAYIEKMGLPRAGVNMYFTNTSTGLDVLTIDQANALESAFKNGPNSATSETVLFSTINGKPPRSANYLWIAIGGLT